MRDYSKVEEYLNNLSQDIYEQPEDKGHYALTREVIQTWMSRLVGCQTVLDVGCGEGYAQKMFEAWGAEYTGVALGKDVIIAHKKHRNVKKMDFTFLDFPDNSFDLVFSRHSLEHSPMPLITLMEWYRVAKHWIGIVLPSIEHYGFVGQNHYSVMPIVQAHFLLKRAGFNPIWTEAHKGEDGIPDEYWIMSEKQAER